MRKEEQKKAHHISSTIVFWMCVRFIFRLQVFITTYTVAFFSVYINAIQFMAIKVKKEKKNDNNNAELINCIFF